MICVECGAEAPRLIGGSCPTCFVGKTKLLEAPDVLDVQLCAHCDARQVGAHWLDPVGDEDLGAIRENAVRDAVRPHRLVQAPALSFEEAAQDERNFLVTVHLEGAVEGAAVNAESRVTVRMRRGVCDRCSRMFGGFYASMLQLRATGRDLTPKELE
ncbi:MAG TPA: NMD3-related protein, partial [Candidatus Thermoplasmatota archaeon]|nr:NMD3-related protein [Candidatus Thermoplasmatota archaeon]